MFMNCLYLLRPSYHVSLEIMAAQIDDLNVMVCFISQLLVKVERKMFSCLEVLHFFAP